MTCHSCRDDKSVNPPLVWRQGLLHGSRGYRRWLPFHAWNSIRVYVECHSLLNKTTVGVSIFSLSFYRASGHVIEFQSDIFEREIDLYYDPDVLLQLLFYFWAPFLHIWRKQERTRNKTISVLVRPTRFLTSISSVVFLDDFTAPSFAYS